MEEGERSPLLPQDTAGQKVPLSVRSPPTSGCPGPVPWENQAEGWDCSCCPLGTKRQALRATSGKGTAPSLSAGSSCVKYLIFLSNFLFTLLGLLALAIGLWGLAVKGSLGSDLGRPLPADPMLGLALGGLAVSAVSLAGCLGALCENTCLLRGFSGGILAFLVLEAVVGALVVALWGPLQDSLEHTLQVAITHYQDDPDLRFLIDQVQLGLRCCGAASYQDWQQNLYFNCSSPGVQACSLPASCCIDPHEDGASVNDQCGFGVLGLDAEAAQRVVYLEGCGPPLQQWLRANLAAAGGYAIAVVLLQGAELLLAARLLRALAARRGAASGPGALGEDGTGHPGPGLRAAPAAKPPRLSARLHRGLGRPHPAETRCTHRRLVSPGLLEPLRGDLPSLPMPHAPCPSCQSPMEGEATGLAEERSGREEILEPTQAPVPTPATQLPPSDVGPEPVKEYATL
ncbi:tetraspanin-10 [Sapajus apella]|uniref:Tetraspanin-10 n=1 Tax=Sapajus apella TaxID=9515 RepID=A0A6J3EWS3_SAPAP|nr:tetraspanin-10 [Sapajus apella]